MPGKGVSKETISYLLVGEYGKFIVDFSVDFDEEGISREVNGCGMDCKGSVMVSFP